MKKGLLSKQARLGNPNKNIELSRPQMMVEVAEEEWMSDHFSLFSLLLCSYRVVCTVLKGFSDDSWICSGLLGYSTHTPWLNLGRGEVLPLLLLLKKFFFRRNGDSLIFLHIGSIIFRKFSSSSAFFSLG
jgi:hypothetical protein